MIFSYNWLQSYFKKRLPKPEKLAEFLTMHSFEVEDLKKIGKDWILDIDILPNRGSDCFSHIGIAREIGAVLNYKFQASNFKLKEDKKLKTRDFISVEVKDKKACPRYTARVIVGVKVASSPKWIQQRIEACGVRPINNIVDIVNYAMLETGQPLHAFDLEKLEGGKIIIRFANRRERIVSLDEENYDLNDDILVIADEKKPVAIAGIKGGKIPEVDKNTKIVALEAANFNLHSIRISSKKLDLKTDASWRFEHGIDPNLAEIAINRAAFLIRRIAGGKIAKGLVDIYPKKVLPKKIKLDLNYVGKLLGVEISQKEIIRILESLEFEVRRQKTEDKEQILVTVPTERLDILIPEDLIEEIGRIYGYEKIEARSPILPVALTKKNTDLLWEKKTKEIMKELGFIEVYNYSFISDKDAELLEKNIGVNQRLDRRKSASTLIEVENPISSSAKYLRPSLLPNLLKVVKNNQKRFDEIKLFETGKVYQQETNNSGQTTGKLVVEKKILGGIVDGKDKFYELKGLVSALFENLGIVDVFFDPYQPIPEKASSVFWQIEKTAEIRQRQGNTKLGFLGEISGKVREFYQIEKPIFGFEIDFEKLVKLVEGEHEYEAPSPYPEVIRDIAVLVSIKTLADEVIQKIHFIGGKIIRDVEIFDIFQGPPLPEEKKNLAFRIIYQAKDRNLTSKEINKIQEKITKSLEKNSQWQVRR